MKKALKLLIKIIIGLILLIAIVLFIMLIFEKMYTTSESIDNRWQIYDDTVNRMNSEKLQFGTIKV